MTTLDGEDAARHVVTGANDAVLDGFTVTGGDASGAGTTDKVGGGMLNDCSDVTVSNCTFLGNSADDDGGGVWSKDSAPVLVNCVFSGNSADDRGGAVCNVDSSPSLTNCTFSGNSAMNGGAVCNAGAATATVTNCILWGDSPDELDEEATGSFTVTYSDVEGGCTGAGNVDADPLFVDPDGADDTAGTADDDLGELPDRGRPKRRDPVQAKVIKVK